jgi:hypothetical protein
MHRAGLDRSDERRCELRARADAEFPVRAARRGLFVRRAARDDERDLQLLRR